MSAVTIFTLVATAVLIAALAVYLIRILLILHRIVDTLGKVTFGLRAIAHRTQPIGPLLDEVNTTLRAVADAAEATVARLAGSDQAKVS